MRNLEKGKHIFIAFQDGKAVLDSQRRPRMYTSLENADKWTPTVDKGKIEYVEYAPTITPPEIVCCQDCVHHEDGYAHWCNKWKHTCPDDSEFFCKFGRKKDENTTD